MLTKSQQLILKSANRQIFNPTVIKHNQFDLHIATAKQCGTHWIKYMLSLILCEIYDLPPPEHIIEDNVVGHTKTPPRYSHIPQIAVTHSHPHYLLRMPNAVSVLKLPKFLIMVRDPRDILVSAYEKAKGDYLNNIFESNDDVDFSTFLRADINLKKPFADIWSIILFFNSWGAINKKNNAAVQTITYEDLKHNTAANLAHICNILELEGVTEDIINNAIAKSSRKNMKEKLNPHEEQAEKSVNIKVRNFKQWYSPEDQKFVNDIFERHLKYDYGYDLNNWT